MTTPVAIILAAGKGTRMVSDLPKVLHRMAGEPLVAYPIRAAREVGASTVVLVVGYREALVRQEVGERFSVDEGWLRFATQAEQLGTGHAVMCALPALEGIDGTALVLSGDVPLLREKTLRALVERCEATAAGLALTTFEPPDPTGYGRILRDADGRVVAIREHRDATLAERAVGECNAGTYAVGLEHLRADLPRVQRSNAQGEIYLTDLVELAAARGEVAALRIDPLEAAGVNTPQQLAELEAAARARG
ncbi:sugar phosphate nucleotidyltransferase [Paraliomyxa miuraensis]|uniref:sugar phosphate nucleotidyltransferase n=1 Tax=Paraliomyxa miuraensis TaxID=376150 RepID=UPI002251E96E|nr:NTP transferase domain-containing protein [Paraliomyxa miuraensis]MCX4240735.1 NTP transferase domain-containing protein [Paraliomyxa miuraensis]